MKPVLIIDPGHGGNDPGGGTNSDWLEKDLTLEISLYQYMRYQELGIPVELTRDTDKSLSPRNRVTLVRMSGATYCHSNHINAGGGDGAELIHSIYSDGKMAERIANKLKQAGQNVRRIFTRTLTTNEKKDYYFMHRETGEVETIIIEYGFADSLKDDRFQLKDNWQVYAEAAVKGFCEYAGYDYHLPNAQEKIGHVPWYVGRRVESKVNDLRFYNKASWEDDAFVNTINKGIGFPKIIEKVTVGNGEQYIVENSKGETYYITAHDKYVHVV